MEHHVRAHPKPHTCKTIVPPANRSVPALEQLISSTTRSLNSAPPDLMRQLDHLDTTIANLDAQQGRHLIRILSDLRSERDDLKAHIAKYRDGTVANSYRHSADGFLRRIRRVTKDDAATGSVKESIIALSSDQQHQRYRKRSDLTRVIRMASRVGNVCEEEKHAIVDEFLSEFHQLDPPVYLMHGDLCPTCDGQMMKTENSTMECATCGTSTVLRDGISTSIGYNDEIEFSTFAYKRDNHFQEWMNAVCFEFYIIIIIK